MYQQWLVILISLLFVPTLWPATITDYITNPNASTATSTAGSSGQTNVRVRFYTSANTIELYIWNFQILQSGDIQTIGGVNFNLSTPISNFAGLSITAKESDTTTIAANGTHVDLVDNWNNLTNHWQAVQGTAAGYTNGVSVNTFSGGNPTQTIIGPATSTGSGVYDGGNVNKSVTNHNPFLLTNETNLIAPNLSNAVYIRLNAPGVTDTTRIVSVMVNFGTDTTAPLALIEASAPEPGTEALIGVTLLCGVLFHRRKRSQRTIPSLTV